MTLINKLLAASSSVAITKCVKDLEICRRESAKDDTKLERWNVAQTWANQFLCSNVNVRTGKERVVLCLRDALWGGWKFEGENFQGPRRRRRRRGAKFVLRNLIRISGSNSERTRLRVYCVFPTSNSWIFPRTILSRLPSFCILSRLPSSCTTLPSNSHAIALQMNTLLL